MSKISMQKYANNTICFIEHYDNISISQESFKGVVSDKKNNSYALPILNNAIFLSIILLKNYDISGRWTSYSR